ncbi:Per os infectivity factor 9 [Trabala vishnou gigantina nucleopolyhedrovirus]|uniref:Per os infectivity factor 9 n=1 Tax=Trabala vishnou gigantina nucleopolyhedrovirus TaxID=2863583 RepID=UPI002481F1BE|nr:Per os infectivity factor 9 [Trabala vishnou gigantina nucleopolyhedrovirus]QYC92779.1 Per os infectivity factor 9 [Trabala vishnou gigantina nucleopolyhedrovirus]
MMRKTAVVLNGASPTQSIVDHDQLQQIVSRNQVFLRDFILVICCILVFVILIMFILFIIFIAKNMETVEINTMQMQKQFLTNLDYRNA